MWPLNKRQLKKLYLRVLYEEIRDTVKTIPVLKATFHFIVCYVLVYSFSLFSSVYRYFQCSFRKLQWTWGSKTDRALQYIFIIFDSCHFQICLFSNLTLPTLVFIIKFNVLFFDISINYFFMVRSYCTWSQWCYYW